MRYLLILLILMASSVDSKEVTLAEFKLRISPHPQLMSWLEGDRFKIFQKQSYNYQKALALQDFQIWGMWETELKIIVWMDGWKFVVSADLDEYLIAKCESEPMLNHTVVIRAGKYTFLPLYWHERLLKELVK